LAPTLADVEHGHKLYEAFTFGDLINLS